jgi:hypothetical protein
VAKINVLFQEQSAKNRGRGAINHWSTTVPIVRGLEEASGAVVVRASPESEANLAKPLREALTGAGKLASEGFIDRNVLAIPSEQLKDVQVLQTWVGGELVYERL